MTPEKQIAADILNRVRQALSEATLESFHKDTRSQMVKGIEERVAEYGRNLPIHNVTGHVVDGYRVTYHKNGATVRLLSEGKEVERYPVRSGRIANLIGKYHKRGTIIVSFVAQPPHPARILEITGTQVQA